MSLMSKR